MSDQDNDLPFPEMLALSNCIDRLSEYAMKTAHAIRISVSMELKPNGNKVSQQFVILTSPTNIEDEKLFDKVHKECTQIVKEEFENVYPELESMVVPLVNGSTPDLKNLPKPKTAIKSTADKSKKDIPSLPGPEQKKPGNLFMDFDNAQ